MPPTGIRAPWTCTSATCARSSRSTPRTRSTCSRCAASATGSATPSPERISEAPMRLSLRNRLVLFFFAVTLLAIGALYLYVVPDLQSRLLSSRLSQLAADAERDSSHIAATVGTSLPVAAVIDRVDAASLASGDRVTLLLVTRARGRPQ